MKQQRTGMISVVLAAYNEETVIAKSLIKICELLNSQGKYDWELICVDDGSKDNTLSIMKKTAGNDPKIKIIAQPRNFGQGRALREGFKACSGDIIVTMDADLSYGPQYIIKLAAALEEEHVDISLASAYKKGGKVANVPLYRYFLSKYGNKYLAKMGPYNISTSTCVVRAYRREVIESLFLISNGMELQLEILMKSAMMGFRVHEVPAELIWPVQKKSGASLMRVSKMRILRSIRLYLLMGWLEKPAMIFLVSSGMMLLVGCYMAIILISKSVLAIASHLNEDILSAISSGIREVFNSYTYSFSISGGLLIFGFQMLAFALLMIQKKFYFEQMYMIEQYSLLRAKPDKADKLSV